MSLNFPLFSFSIGERHHLLGSVSESLQAAAAVDGPLLQRGGGGGFGAYMGNGNDVAATSAATGASSTSRRTVMPGCVAAAGPGDGPLSSYGSIGRTSGLLGTSAGRDVDPFSMPVVGVAPSGVISSRMEDGIGQVSIETCVVSTDSLMHRFVALFCLRCYSNL